MQSQRSRAATLKAGGLLVAVVVAGLAVGCGDDEDIGMQNERVSSDVFMQLEFAADDSRFDNPSDVACVRPEPGQFVCNASFQVADDVALMAAYVVHGCHAASSAVAVDAHRSLTVPGRLRDASEPDASCSAPSVAAARRLAGEN